MIDLRGFGWRHAGRRAWALREVDLRVARGERVLLLGESGAGKSTLLAALAGLLPEDSGEQAGEASVDGRHPLAAREAVGIVFQDPQSQLVMSRSGDDVAFGLENRGVPADRIWPRVDEALADVGFPYPRDRPTHALSGGEQQRLALAGVLALRPALLLLDEPTANLDPAGAHLVRAALARALAGRDTTMILVEHRVAEALALVDRVVVLAAGGGVLADGDPGEVFAAHGRWLADRGVWVPGYPVPRRSAVAAPGPVLLSGERLGYRHPGAPTAALAGVDVRVRAGQALAVVGPNGSGKSTLARLLGGLVAPGQGRVVAGDALRGPAGRYGQAGARAVPAPSGPPHTWRAARLAERIGSVFQNPEHQFVTNRVDTELALGPRRTGRSAPEIRAAVGELLERLRLSRLAAANPHTLSGGEQRRLSVATALATAPSVLLLDEPTFGQDRRTWAELVDLLAGLRDAGCGVVTVTHDPDVVAALADRTLALGVPAPGVTGAGATGAGVTGAAPGGTDPDGGAGGTGGPVVEAARGGER